MSLLHAAGRARPVALFLCTLLGALSLHALDVPPPPNQWFTDRAGIVSPTEADLLNRKLSDFEQQSGAQFIIYTFPSLEGEALEDFTIRCAEAWKVGQKKYDNGLILFVFVEERKLRIEVGYGLEGTMTDAFSSRVIREFITPAFQRGQYAAGLNAGADAVIKKIRTGEEPVPPMQPREERGRRRGSGDLGIIPIIFILIVIFFVVLPILRGGGGCSGCIWPLIFSGGRGFTIGGGGGGWSGGGGFGGGGGFSGGGGSFGGGGASGGW